MDTPAALTQLVDLAFQILAPTLLALGGWLAHRLVKMLENKTGIKIPTEQNAQIDSWIAEGIRFAEEKAHQAVQKKEAEITGHEKLEAAIGFVADMAAKSGWVGWTRDLLKAKVDAKINVVKERPGSPAGQ